MSDAHAPPVLEYTCRSRCMLYQPPDSRAPPGVELRSPFECVCCDPPRVEIAEYTRVLAQNRMLRHEYLRVRECVLYMCQMLDEMQAKIPANTDDAATHAKALAFDYVCEAVVTLRMVLIVTYTESCV